ncbi:TetR/AcrR family transcriptional regulator [Nocardioides jejuensis]|uniref:TetR family transcriptional regulator n=1 Tax=Nocardioides jejuensis TaxID=2502782 RepID=A0A4V2NZA9_9ACTN|nr:TetR family transcriptional regulator [Nocardioides jejuensis]TCJ28282.1 TetR family transcriptional regulator [Nocardioides jejuensis]
MTTESPPRAVGRSQAERTAASRLELLNAALEVLDESGFAGLTVADVCKRAGRTVGTHLHQFGTKAALVAAAVDALAARRIADARADLEREPRRGAEAALDVVWQFYAGPTFVVALELWVAARTNPELREHLLTVEERIDREGVALAASIAPELATPAGALAGRYAVATMRGLAMRRALYVDADLDAEWRSLKPLLLTTLTAITPEEH